MTTATEQARSWLGDFGDALERGDAGGVAALFHAESYWRDLVAFTWNITTTEGPDDIAAMTELFRILKPGGWAILNVPVTAEVSVDHRTAPLYAGSERDQRPPEYLRTYGKDFPQRMASVGFEVREIRPDDLVDDAARHRLGIATSACGSIYFGTKPQ